MNGSVALQNNPDRSHYFHDAGFGNYAEAYRRSFSLGYQNGISTLKHANLEMGCADQAYKRSAGKPDELGLNLLFC